MSSLVSELPVGELPVGELQPGKQLLNFLLKTATHDELTGLWALGYELSKNYTDYIDKLLIHLTDNLNILFDEEIAKKPPGQNNIFVKIKTDSGTKEIITEETVIKFVYDHNPLIGLESDLSKFNSSSSLKSVSTRLPLTTLHMNHPHTLHMNQPHTLHMNQPDAFSSGIRASGGYVGIKKSRRKKRKRTKRKRTKRKRTKRKSTKRKRTKYKGGMKRGGPGMESAKSYIKRGRASSSSPASYHSSQSVPVAHPEYRGQFPEQQQGNLMIRGRALSTDPAGQTRRNPTIYDRLQTTDTILRPIRNQRWAFAKAQGWGVNLRKYGRTGARRGLATNMGCRDNTGNLVEDLLSGNDDSISIIGSPGPDFSQGHPLRYWEQYENLKNILFDYSVFPPRNRYNERNVFVVILEDENFYRATNGLDFYRTIDKDNRKFIHGIDMKPHDPKQFLQLINFIVGKVSKKLPTIIIIHCFCGAGRTSSMILCSKLYFLIKSISKVIMRSEDNSTGMTPELKQNTCLDIPSLIGFHEGGGTPDQSSINDSPAGKWLLDNYKSHTFKATAPGEEFLKITSNFSKTLFLNRVNNMSSALAEHFGFGSHITPYFDSMGRRIQVGKQNVQYFFGKNPTDRSNSFIFDLYRTNQTAYIFGKT